METCSHLSSTTPYQTETIMDARSFHASKARASNASLTRRELLERDLPAQATGELKILLECWNREGGGRPPRSIRLACELPSPVHVVPCTPVLYSRRLSRLVTLAGSAVKLLYEGKYRDPWLTTLYVRKRSLTERPCRPGDADGIEE